MQLITGFKLIYWSLPNELISLHEKALDLTIGQQHITLISCTQMAITLLGEGARKQNEKRTSHTVKKMPACIYFSIYEEYTNTVRFKK